MSQPLSIRNQLLAALPAPVLEAMRPKLALVQMPLRQPLHGVDADIEFVYFPQTGMISLVAAVQEGMQSEVGIIGREGMLGTSLLAGIARPYVDSMVQLAGSALRMSARDFREEAASNAAFRSLLLRYNEGLIAQVMQTAACNANHGLEERLARWLLMAHDRSDSDELQLTQDFMAMMLGVHRPSITVTAGILQRAGLIRYASGRVVVLQRAELEAASCECYSAVRRRFEALLEHPDV